MDDLINPGPFMPVQTKSFGEVFRLALPVSSLAGPGGALLFVYYLENEL